MAGITLTFSNFLTSALFSKKYRIYSINTRAYYLKSSNNIGLHEVIWVRDLLNDVYWEATFIQITRARTIRTRKKLSFGADY